MSRVLVMVTHPVPHAMRTGYVTALAARRASAKAAGANFWVFEQSDDGGVFLEFLEAANREILGSAVRALNAIGAGFADTAPVWREVGEV